jgi:hypothetical protein
MKFTNQVNLDIKKTQDIEGMDCGIDAANLGFMFEVVSSQMYSNAIGSIVREITSNCFDSHTEAKVDDPVVIKIYVEEGQHFISFIDVGVGLSPDRMSKVYSNYFSSTKRDSNDEIGMWGLGSKSPLSYQDSFILKTRFDGTEYLYIVHKGEKAPRIEKILDIPTTERNGTEVKLAIRSNDLYSFTQEIQRQLSYFDNVYVDDSTNFNLHLNNDYKIYEGDNFLYRNKSGYSNTLHIVLGKVAYPINWDEIQMRSISLPIGVKFKIGELSVTPNRESLKYNEGTRTLIKARIQVVIDELNALYNKQVENTCNFYEYIASRSKEKILYLDDAKEVGIKLNNGIPGIKLNTVSFIPFDAVNIDTPSYDRQFFFEYSCVKTIEKGRLSKKETEYNLYTLLNSNRIVYRISGELNKWKTLYIQDMHLGQPIYLVTKRKTTLKDYKALLPLAKDKSLWREQIKAYQTVLEEALVERSHSYDRVVVPDEWIKDYKKGLKTGSWVDPRIVRKANQQIHSFRLDENAKKWDKFDVKVSELSKFRGIVIYGSHEDKGAIVRVCKALMHSKTLADCNYHPKFKEVKVFTGKGEDRKIASRWRIFQFLTVAASNEKHVRENPRAIRFDQLMQQHFRPLIRYATAIKAKRLIESSGLDHTAAHFKNLYTPVFENYDKVAKFIKNNNFEDISYDMDVSREFIEDILKVAEEQNLFIPDVMESIKFLENYMAGIELLKYVTIDEASSPMVADFLKLKKKRLDTFWYQIPNSLELAILADAEEKKVYIEQVNEAKI